MALHSADRDRLLSLQIAALLGVGILMVGLMLAALSLHNRVQAWLLANQRWMQAQYTMIDALDVYALTGDAYFLQRAQTAEKIPLAARRARLAAEQRPVDMREVHAGLRGMGMDEADVDGMARLYIDMGRWPWVRDAIAIWLRMEPDIDQLDALAKAMAAEHAQGTMTTTRAASYRRQIAQVRARVDGNAWNFSGVLVDGLRALRTALVAAIALLVGALVLLSVLVLRKVATRIRRSEGWLNAAFEQANVGMLQLDAGGRIRQANPAAGRILGLGSESCGGRRLQDFIVAEEQDRFERRMRAGRGAGGGDDSDTFMLEGADGRHQMVRVSLGEADASAAFAPADRFFAMIEDVTEAHAMRAELTQRARYDSLTGLFNRGELQLRISAALHDLREGRIAHLSVCMVDLDLFRHINQSAGQLIGDRILQVVAHRLHDASAVVGQVGRLGSDQFVVVLPGMDVGRAMEFAGRVVEAVARPDRELADSTLTPTASVGVVAVDLRHANASEVLADAATACEQAKQAGRNRVRLLALKEKADDGQRSATDWAREIRAALAEGRMELHAQRIDACHPGVDGVQAELLLRLRDREGRISTPAAFMHVVEMFGLGVALDRHVLQLAAKAIHAHREAGGTPLVFFVNISAGSPGEPGFAAFVRQLLDDDPGLADMLCLEITETGVMANLQEATAFMDMVRQRGCRVALDDFGTGHSSLAHLRALPVDIVKLDGSFVRDIDRDATSEVLVRSICDMSRVLGKRTVVEWVERGSDGRRVSALGADYMQGFGLHRPEPLDAFLAGLAPAGASAVAGTG